MTLSSILLQSSQSGLSSMLMIIAMIAIFYFIMIRPQSKKQKELKKQREAMQKGDRVVTAGGIHGKIRDIKDNAVLIEVAPNVVIKFDKASVYPAVEETSKEAPRKEIEKKGKKEEKQPAIESETEPVEEEK